MFCSHLARSLIRNMTLAGGREQRDQKEERRGKKRMRKGGEKGRGEEEGIEEGGRVLVSVAPILLIHLRATFDPWSPECTNDCLLSGHCTRCMLSVFFFSVSVF